MYFFNLHVLYVNNILIKLGKKRVAKASRKTGDINRMKNFKEKESFCVDSCGTFG